MFNNQVIRKAAALLSGVAVLVSVAACGSASASNSSALEQVKQAGNAVTPPAARDLIAAVVESLAGAS